jgi:RNA polymerase sigma-70 factor (ECF subfamily)
MRVAQPYLLREKSFMVDSLTTRPSLLFRLRNAQDTLAWGEFVELYAPMIHHFCRKQGLQEADAADITQEVLGRLVRAMPQLDYDPERGSFRGWLFTAVRNRLRDFFDHQRRHLQASVDSAMQRGLDALPSRERSLEEEWEQDYRRRLYTAAAAIVRRDVTETTWRAFSLTVVEGRPAPQVAAELGLSVASVYLAKSRVMARLRAEVRQWEEQKEGQR